MSERTYYVICEDNCKFESMTKEQIYEAIAEATGSTPSPVDEAFITKIKEQNANNSIKVWKGTEAQYNALTTKDSNTVYIVIKNTGDPIKLPNDIEGRVDEIESAVDDLETGKMDSDFIDVVKDFRTHNDFQASTNFSATAGEVDLVRLGTYRIVKMRLQLKITGATISAGEILDAGYLSLGGYLPQSYGNIDLNVSQLGNNFSTERVLTGYIPNNTVGDGKAHIYIRTSAAITSSTTVNLMASAIWIM